MATQPLPKHSYKRDKYASARGGSSKFLSLHCSECNAFVALYQKDGPGRLLRLYLDRIFEPLELTSLQAEVRQRSAMPSLKCPKCGSLLGTPMVYKPEKRLAFRLIRGKVLSHKSDGA